MTCPSCGHAVLEIDVKCATCGHALGATGSQRMLGQVVLGQYELVDVLGQGGMSVVFKGKHKMTDQEVALKILPPELAAHSQVKSRFLDEAKALAALDHPNIVHLYNFGQENGLFVLAMQYVKGRTWERIILENKRMDWVSSVKVAIDVLRALEYAHGRGVIHRDMKPSNVLVRSHDGMATVMDFGIAKMTTSTKLTATGQTMGTVRYMSPEQVRGQEVDLRTDLYSLGATLYESLTGETPFDGNTHFEIMTKHLSEVPLPLSAKGIDVPVAVEEAILRSLSKKIDDRYENAREMRKVLEAALKEGDLGISDTQRINADVLVRAAPPPAVKPRAVTAVTAGNLADELEPGHTGAATVPSPVRKKSRMPLFALLAVLLAGGAVGTLFIVKSRSSSKGFHTQLGIRGVALTAGQTVDGIRIETSGQVTPGQVAAEYVAALERNKVAETFIDQIVVIPALGFCEDTVIPAILRPTNCGQQIQATVITNKRKKRLVLVDDPARLPAALDLGVLNAACVFGSGGSESPVCTRYSDLEQSLAAPPAPAK